MRFKIGREPTVVHPQYGDGKLLKIFKVKNTRWYTVRINDSLIVETPMSEWKFKKAGE